MTNAKLTELVDRLIVLDRQIAEAEKRFKEARKALLKEARARKSEYTKTEGGGRSWIAQGSDGAIARVTFPAAKLRSALAEDSEVFGKLSGLIGKDGTKALLIEVVGYKLVQDFRAEALKAYPLEKAHEIIKLCQTKSEPTVSFETKEVQP